MSGFGEFIGYMIMFVFFCNIIGIIIATITNIYHVIVDYRKPELFCSNCGKKITKGMYKCPKCKRVFVSEDKKKVE